MAPPTKIRSTADTGSVAEDGILQTTATSGVLANDTGAQTVTNIKVGGKTATVPAGGVTVQGTYGYLTIYPDGSYTYTASTQQAESLAQGSAGSDVFTYTASDGSGNTTTNKLTINVTGVNDAPVAVADSGTVGEKSVLTVSAASGVLVNDTDPDAGDTKTVSAVNGSGTSVGKQIVLSSGALLTLTADGSYSYDPNHKFDYLGLGQSATDSFTYTVSDSNGATSTATATITITGQNDAAVIGVATVSGVTEDTGVNALGDLTAAGTLSISDADQGQSAFQTTVTSAQGNLGTLTLAGDGNYSYAVANSAVQHLGAGATKVDSFTVTSLDGTTETVSFTITGQNDAPVAMADSASTLAGQALVLSAAGLLVNDTDADGDTLAITGVGGATHGTVSFDATRQEIAFTPDADYTGPASFTYAIADGNGGAAQAAVGVMVDPPPSTLAITFRQGANGYTGAVDTMLKQAKPDTAFGSAIALSADAGTGVEVQALLAFQALFGTGPGQIPPGATITSATLTLQITNGSAKGGSLNRMLIDWNGASTWNTLGINGNGVQVDGTEASTSDVIKIGAVSLGSGTFDVTNSLKAWAAAGATFAEQNAANHGWVFKPSSTDGWDFTSSEGSIRPLLNVTYTPNAVPPPSSTPTVSIQAGAPNPQTEGESAKITFTVSLSHATDQDVTVSYSTVDRTAKAGSDYDGANGSVKFLAGETIRTIEILLKD